MSNCAEYAHKNIWDIVRASAIGGFLLGLLTGGLLTYGAMLSRLGRGVPTDVFILILIGTALGLAIGIWDLARAIHHGIILREKCRQQ